MGTSTQEKAKKKNKFTAVDLFQKSYGSVSVKAIYELFREKKGIDPRNLHKHTFHSMVEFLRRDADPLYVSKY